MTDALTQETLFQRDAVGRLTQETRSDGELTLFSYDDNGNMTFLTPPGKPSHGFNYTPVDLVSDYVPPVAEGSGANLTRHEYNLDRQLYSTFFPDLTSIQVGFDTAGRVETKTLPDGVVTYGYDPGTGQLASIGGPYGTTLSYGYNGSLMTSMGFAGEVTGSVEFAHNNDFRVVTETVNGADPVTFGHDDDGLIVQAGAMTVGRDPQNGRLTGTTLGNVGDGYSYNPYGEVEGYLAQHGSSDLYSVGYTHDALGRILTKTEVIGGETHAYGYTYDLAGRLWQLREDGLLISEYSYDANGNRLSLTTPSGTTSGTYDGQDRLLSYGTKTYTHTANGEILTKTDSATSETTTYAYNLLGALTRVDLPDGRVVEYITDGTGRRIGKKVDGVLVQGLLYRGTLEPVAELDGAGNVVGRFVYALGRNVPEYVVRGGVAYRIITDHLGSLRLVVNVSTGEVVQRMAYDAYGVVLVDEVASGWAPVPFGFAGGIYDRDAGLVRFGLRDYDAEVGRWTAPDPIRFRGGDTNLYSYVAGDPVNRIDPRGLDACSDCLQSTSIAYESCKVGCSSIWWSKTAKALCLQTCQFLSSQLDSQCDVLCDPPQQDDDKDWGICLGPDEWEPEEAPPLTCEPEYPVCQ